MTVLAPIANVTLRALLGRRRSILMLLLAATPVLLGLLIAINDEQLSPRRSARRSMGSRIAWSCR